MGFDAVRVRGHAVRRAASPSLHTAAVIGAPDKPPVTRRQVSWSLIAVAGVAVAFALVWSALTWASGPALVAYAESPSQARMAEGSAGGPPAAWMTQSLAPAPVNVQLAKQRVAEMFPGIEAKLATPDAPSVTQEPGTARYTWALDAKHGRIASADVQSAYVVLDPGGRLIGFGLE